MRAPVHFFWVVTTLGLQWRKDDTQNREAFHIFCPHLEDNSDDIFFLF